jgi:hypothetical protein
MNKKQIRAGELLARLNADPEWVAARAVEEEKRQKLDAEYREAEIPLVQALLRVGIKVSSAWDLVGTSTPYPAALPVLLEHLKRPYPSAVREGIARALAVPDAKFGWETLARLFREESEKRVKDGLAAAIGVVADDSVMDETISLAEDKRLGSSRVLLLRALANSRKPEVYEALRRLRSDPDLRIEVQRILRYRQAGQNSDRARK